MTKTTRTGIYGGRPTPPTPLYFMRQLHRLKQRELASRTGVTRETISRLESGLQVPQHETALRLAAALGCSVESLFPLKDDGRPAGEVR